MKIKHIYDKIKHIYDKLANAIISISTNSACTVYGLLKYMCTYFPNIDYIEALSVTVTRFFFIILLTLVYYIAYISLLDTTKYSSIEL